MIFLKYNKETVKNITLVSPSGWGLSVFCGVEMLFREED